MKKYMKQVILLLSVCFLPVFLHSEAKASEPQKPLAAYGSVPNLNYTLTAIDDTQVSTTAVASKTTVLVFGSVKCGNTISTIRGISRSSWVKNPDVRVIFANANPQYGTKEDTKSFADTYGCSSIISCYEVGGVNNRAMWDYLDTYGYDPTQSVTLPITALVDSSNKIQNVMTGSVSADKILAEINRIKNEQASSEAAGGDGGASAGTAPENPAAPLVPVHKKNDVLTDKKTNGKYRISSVNNKGGSVEYRCAANKKSTSVKIPATITIDGKTYKVTAVAANAFKGNKKLKTVTIGKNVKSIGKNCFYGCKNLKKIVVKTTSLSKKSVGSRAFKSIYSKATIKVPKSKLKAYKKILKAKGAGSKVKIRK